MKKILSYICMALLVLSAVSCKNKKSLDNKINVVGSWELTDIQTKSAQIGDQPVSVYLDFTATDFTIYQMIGEGRYRKYTGTYTITGGVLDGKYSSGDPLGSSWKVSLSGDTLVLESNSETDTYRKASIPEDLQYI